MWLLLCGGLEKPESAYIAANGVAEGEDEARGDPVVDGLPGFTKVIGDLGDGLPSSGCRGGHRDAPHVYCPDLDLCLPPCLPFLLQYMRRRNPSGDRHVDALHFPIRRFMVGFHTPFAEYVEDGERNRHLSFGGRTRYSAGVGRPIDVTLVRWSQYRSATARSERDVSRP